MFEPNRLSVAIAQIQERLDRLTSAKRKQMDIALNLTSDEHAAYQNLQSSTFASGSRLTTDEAQIIYQALGEYGTQSNGGWANGTKTATKVIVTKVIHELLTQRINVRRRTA